MELERKNNMGYASYSKIGVNPRKEKQIKLKIDEYILEIGNVDIVNVTLNYYLDKILTKKFKDGKEVDVVEEPVIFFELDGIDKYNKEAFVSFGIKADLNMLNGFSKKPTDITNYLMDSEAFIKKVDENNSNFLNIDKPCDTLDDIYKNLSSLWISKLEENVFIIKLFVANEVFTYFKITFDEEENYDRN